MFKRTLFFSLIISAVAASVIVSAHGDETENELHPFGFRGARDFSTVRGRVTFQRRTTLVPQTVCGDGPCIRPQPYWTLVVYGQDKTRYELDQVFYLGHSRAPENLEINGMVIRPGAKVLIEGKVEQITEDYSIVSDVRRIDLVSDARRADATFIPNGTVSPLNTGWTCRSDDALGTQINAQVWYGASDQNESFRMRLLAKLRNGTTQEILHSDDVGMRAETDQIFYRASTADSVAELEIRQSENALFDLPSTLRIFKSHKLSPALDVSAQISLRCTPTQLF